MKYISTLIFALALVYTWNLVQQQPPVDFGTHAALQVKLGEAIIQTIQEMKPQATDITLLKVSTVTIDPDTVKARIAYKFNEPDTTSGEIVEQQIEGEVTLKKATQTDSEREMWAIENVSTSTGAITFKTGLVISPNETDEETSLISGEEGSPTEEATPVPPAPTMSPSAPSQPSHE